MMLQKKVCMVGAFAVGKTSLVQRFVSGIFSDKYLTTVGVKIDKATVETASTPVSLILWDLAGEDGFQSFHASYLNGSRGLIFVIDQTRRATFDTALALKERVENSLGVVPSVAFVNKSDLAAQNELSTDDIARLEQEFDHIFRTSAKSGDGVEPGFFQLAGMMLAAGDAKLLRRG